ncbi:MAG TPA: hypothetical protein VK497_00665 [Candidatus Saccharimonadales bacterium]|nr:hypothetical protein [Candidatus Saccharimonadales bacterium]
MGDPIALGDTLPELVEALVRAEFRNNPVLTFSARGEDYEVFWVEGMPQQMLRESSSGDQNALLWISFPLKRVSVNREDIPRASTIKLYPDRQLLLILDKDGEILETSSPITLITPSPI